MTFSVSTATLNSSLRLSVLDTQARLVQAQQEASTGRVADLGLALGSGAGRDFALASSQQDIQTITATNKLVTIRLDTTQSVLTNLSGDASKLRSTLVSALTDGGDRTAIRTQAGFALGAFTSGLNSTDGASYIFGGINSDKPPIADYAATPVSANKQAVDQAFSTYFGFSQSDPKVASITAAQIQGFLDGPLTALFSDPAWKNWSSASNEPIQSRIDISQTANTSVSADDPALQKLALAYTIVNGLGAENLSADAYNAVIKTAAQNIDAGVTGLTQTQAAVGVIQKSVSDASDKLAAQDTYLSLAIGSLENVDPYQAATQVNSLTTQLETSYTLTAKIQQLSLSKYL
jgi:flagellar hook-associated protein 3 FlgL